MRPAVYINMFDACRIIVLSDDFLRLAWQHYESPIFFVCLVVARLNTTGCKQAQTPEGESVVSSGVRRGTKTPVISRLFMEVQECLYGEVNTA